MNLFKVDTDIPFVRISSILLLVKLSFLIISESLFLIIFLVLITSLL